MLNEDDARFLKGLQDELNSQPTLGTADPRFWVVMSKHWEPCFGDDEPDGAFVDGDPERIDDIAEEVYRVLEEDEGEDAADAWALSYDVRMPSEGVFDFRGCADDLFEEYASAIDANSDLLRAAVSSLESSLAGVSDRQIPQVLGALYASLVVEYGGYAAAIACEFYERQRAASIC